MSSTTFSSKDSWQREFENEPINDDRWSCIVTAINDFKADPDDPLTIIARGADNERIPLVQMIKMSDVVSLLNAQGKNKEDKKKKGIPVKELKTKEEDTKKSTASLGQSSRFSEVPIFVSKNSTISDGQCITAPIFMAYILKYMILNLKNVNCYKRKLNNMLRKIKKEERIKYKLLSNSLDVDEQETEEKSTGISWERNMFDILLGNPLDGPFNGPEMYIVLSQFHNPMYFVELLKINVPVKAVIKIEGTNTSNLWNEFEQIVEQPDTTSLLKDVAYLKCNKDVDKIGIAASEDSTLMATPEFLVFLFSIFNLSRLHETYIQQMNVQRMYTSLEPVDLRKCVVYNRLCDSLINEDANAEIFVLYAIIEQVVDGIPPTTFTISEYEYPRSQFLTDKPTTVARPQSNMILPETFESDIIQNLAEPVKGNIQNNPNSPVMLLYDDNISLATLTIDRTVLKTEEIFRRFLINSSLSKLQIKFPNINSAQGVLNNFQFYRLWQKSKEKEDVFKAKMLFFVAMRLIEKLHSFSVCTEVSSDCSATVQSGCSSTDIPNTVESDALDDETDTSKFNSDNVLNLFYARTNTKAATKFALKMDKDTETKGEKMKKDGRTSTSKELKKAIAMPYISPFQTQTVEELEVACGRTMKMQPQLQKECCQNLSRIEKIFSFNEIVDLNENNLLVNQDEFRAFVKQHKFCEKLESNRTVQKLDRLYNNFNSREFVYFTPTDSLFVVGLNNVDYRGVHYAKRVGKIDSPLAFRDFVTYVVPEMRKWLKQQNTEYVAFLKNLQKRTEDDEKRREHQIKCSFVKRYNAGEDIFGNSYEKVDDEKGGRKGLRLKREDEHKNSQNNPELEDLPVKVKLQLPEESQIDGINIDPIRTEVTEDVCEFHSKDGTMVRACKEAWLYGSVLITVTVQRQECKLILHKWKFGHVENKLSRFIIANGIKVNLNVGENKLGCTVTWPNGLIIQPIRKNRIYIRQEYMQPYRTKIITNDEKYRCFLNNGQVLIFRDKRIDILHPSGTKYSCDATTSEVIIHEMTTSTGEFWTRDGKCKTFEKNLALIGAVDPKTKETFYKREDGTIFMLWPNGKLVTLYPDGTKITSIPEFVELNSDKEADSNKMTDETKDLNTETAPNQKPRISFCLHPMDEGSVEDDDEFNIITCKYIIEHPNYATVEFKSCETVLRMIDETTMTISHDGKYKIETHRTELKATRDAISFYNVCKDSGKRSISQMYPKSIGNEVLSRTNDSCGVEFYVYGSGEVLRKSVDEKNFCLHAAAGSIVSPQAFSVPCNISRSCKCASECLIIQRDLTAMEFITKKCLLKYAETLSEECNYDLYERSPDGTQTRHSFYNPIYKIGNEKYLMSYGENDIHPRRLRRKHLMPIKEMHNAKLVLPIITSFTNTPPVCERPKAVILRFLDVLNSPSQIMEQMDKLIVWYQKSAADITTEMRKCSVYGMQHPFANYVDRELQFIASRLCHSLELYPHTCTIIPTTEIDVHQIGHKAEANSQLVEENPNDFEVRTLPSCKRIPKPLKHYNLNTEIPEQDEV